MTHVFDDCESKKTKEEIMRRVQKIINLFEDKQNTKKNSKTSVYFGNINAKLEKGGEFVTADNDTQKYRLCVSGVTSQLQMNSFLQKRVPSCTVAATEDPDDNGRCYIYVESIQSQRVFNILYDFIHLLCVTLSLFYLAYVFDLAGFRQYAESFEFVNFLRVDESIRNFYLNISLFSSKNV